MPDPVESAHSAGLRYVTDERPGIRRQRAGRGFKYLDSDGKVIRDRAVLDRVRALVIPPAWTDVWICPIEDGHLQATGRDDRNRKQYLYHQRWREVRDETKYEKMIAFGEALPQIRQRVEADLARRGLPRERVLAAVVRLLETTFIRVGNEEYARANDSFGLTTLKTKHVDVTGSTIHFEFRGKSGVEFEIDLHDPRLAKIVEKCQDLPGQELFQYVDEDGALCSLDSADVNKYLREAAGQDFTAKDFRTWCGTAMTAEALEEIGEFRTQSEAKRNVNQAIACVAAQLGNTKTVCRQCYIHPAILEAYLDGSLLDELKKHRRKRRRRVTGLSREEAAVLEFLRERIGKPRPRKAHSKT
jgi:DNA topoisomerase-1